MQIRDLKSTMHVYDVAFSPDPRWGRWQYGQRVKGLSYSTVNKTWFELPKCGVTHCQRSRRRRISVRVRLQTGKQTQVSRRSRTCDVNWLGVRRLWKPGSTYETFDGRTCEKLLNRIGQCGGLEHAVYCVTAYKHSIQPIEKKVRPGYLSAPSVHP